MDDHQNPAGEGDLPALSPPDLPVLAADPPSPLLADRLMRSLSFKTGKPLSPEQQLAAQAHMLDSLFTTMLLSRPAAGQVFDERFNLAVALRAQKQSAQAFAALALIRHRRNTERE